jgi:hypothetical protein
VGTLQLQRQECRYFSRNKRPPRRSTSQKHTISIKKLVSDKFFSPLVGDPQEQPQRRPRVGRPPDRLHHAVLDLEW